MGWDSWSEAIGRLERQGASHWDGYLGFYSSWLGGYFREPWGMLVPSDDCGFHRGDGVFEAVRIHEGAYFDLPTHLERLLQSAAQIGLVARWSQAQLSAICVELASRCAARQALLRLFLTRGPGGFSPSPTESVGAQLYAVLTRLSPPAVERYQQGVRACLSSVVAKEPWYAQIKSLNYLQNVLLKKDCLERGYDLAVCVDGSGRLCEGATENIMLVTAARELLVPRFDYTLKGTTVRQVMAIAKEQAFDLKAVRFADVTVADVHAAAEAAFVGTTLGVLPIASLNDKPIGLGRGGPVSLALHERLLWRMAHDPLVRTAF